jgi:hypothetical protein
MLNVKCFLNKLIIITGKYSESLDSAIRNFIIQIEMFETVIKIYIYLFIEPSCGFDGIFVSFNFTPKVDQVSEAPVTKISVK